MSSHASLSTASDERKARLAKLRSLKRKQPTDEIVAPESDRASPHPPTTVPEPSNDGATPEPDVARLHLSGRNYDPETRGPKLGFEAPPTAGIEDRTLEAQAALIEDDVKERQAEEAQEDKAIDLFKLQPKKPNWDLKRELNRKLEVLNVRTDNAIARLVRERLAAKKGASAVKDGAVDGESAAGQLQGVEVLEGIRLREQEEEEEGRRERELDDLDRMA